MKHNLKITAIILGMFILTQLIGMFVINFYLGNTLPYGLGVSFSGEQNYTPNFVSIIISFVIAISLFFILTKYKIKHALRIWFFVVVLIALGVTFSAFLLAIFPNIGTLKWISLFALVLALPLALSKIYSRNILSHNISELFIYPGIAVLFIPLLNVLYLAIFLILISVYDMWAVWKSGIMQKMAKYQIKELKLFSGFFVPYLNKEQRKQIKLMKGSSKSKTKKIKVSVAMLGGGDVIFPIISAGVLYQAFNNFLAPLFVILGALLGLGLLLLFSQKKKFYPAMPFISAGIFLAIGVCYLVL